MGHSYNCVLADESELRSQIKHLVWLVEARNQTHQHYQSQLAALHAKLALLKHENNKLRRKLPGKPG